jgi:hypothetical protein
MLKARIVNGSINTPVVMQQLGRNATIQEKMFAKLDNANPDTGNISGLNLASVKHTTVQVTRVLL